mgnify:CR=1 FL=1
MSMNVRFLKGTQSKLNTLTSYTPGAFYITDEESKNSSKSRFFNSFNPFSKYNFI